MINVTTLIFKIVNFPFLDGDVPRSTSYGVYISQFIRFARASSPQRGTLIFSYIRRLGPFFWVQNFEFRYFLGFSEK